MRPLPLVPISPPLLKVDPHEQRDSVLFEPLSKYWDIVGGLPELSLLHGGHHPFNISSQDRFSSPLIILPSF